MGPPSRFEPDKDNSITMPHSTTIIMLRSNPWNCKLRPTKASATTHSMSIFHPILSMSSFTAIAASPLPILSQTDITTVYIDGSSVCPELFSSSQTAMASEYLPWLHDESDDQIVAKLTVHDLLTWLTHAASSIDHCCSQVHLVINRTVLINFI